MFSNLGFTLYPAAHCLVVFFFYLLPLLLARKGFFCCASWFMVHIGGDNLWLPGKRILFLFSNWGRSISKQMRENITDLKTMGHVVSLHPIMCSEGKRSTGVNFFS